MGMTIYLDTLDGATLDYSSTVSRQVRTGVALEIPINGDPDLAVLHTVFNGLWNAGFTWGSFYAIGSNLVLTRIVVRSITADSAQFWLYYETPTGGVVPGAYIYRDESHLVESETEFLPGTRQLISVSFTSPRNAQDRVPKDRIPIRYLQPMRGISIAGMIFGQPPGPLRDVIGQVNADPWCGKEPGFWLLSEFNMDITKYTGYYVLQAKAITQVTEDWAQMGSLRRRENGRAVDVNPSDVTFLADAPYSYGLLYPNGDQTRGVVKIGPYPMTNFTDLLGSGPP